MLTGHRYDSQLSLPARKTSWRAGIGVPLLVWPCIGRLLRVLDTPLVCARAAGRLRGAKRCLDAAAHVRLPPVCLPYRTTCVTRRRRAQELPASVEAVGASALVLDASNNRLTALPASLGALTGLTRLVVPHNALRALPPQLTALASLRARPYATRAPRAHQLQGAPSERNPQGRQPPGVSASACVPGGGCHCLDRSAWPLWLPGCTHEPHQAQSTTRCPCCSEREHTLTQRL